jgi:hypothetical protein
MFGPMRNLARQVRGYYKKSRFLNPNAMPWTRARLKWMLMRRDAYVVWPLYGHVIPALKEGRLELGRHVSLQAGCWLNLGTPYARIRIGRNTYLNGNLMIASYSLIEVGEFTMLSRGCLLINATHRTGDPTLPVPQQGMEEKGPITIGNNVWIGANAAIIGSVRIGDRAVIGANSVVTRDVEAGMIVAGSPAREIRRVETIRPAEEA